MSTDQHFKDKLHARKTLTERGYIKLPRKKGYLPIIGMEYWRHPHGPMIAGVREIKQQNGNKCVVFYRDPTELPSEQLKARQGR